jgi:hypothetical protein
MQSETIGALAAALSKAQADITGALKDSSNPFFKSKYADLASCWDACRKQLAANGLSVIQTTRMADQGLVLVTTLAHSSGEWIAGEMPVLIAVQGKSGEFKEVTPQAQGSGITYARRYALAAIVGLAQVDDDAEAAQGRKPLTVDPRGDLGQDVDPAKRDIFVNQFRAAFDMDADEYDIALAVLAVHELVNPDHDLYIAVANAMTAKERSAIKKYIQMTKEKHRAA